MTIPQESRVRTEDPTCGPQGGPQTLSVRHMRLNRRKRKMLGIGEFARNALAVDLRLDGALEPHAATATRRSILGALGALRMSSTGVFRRVVAELVLQAPHGLLDEQHEAVVIRRLQAIPGVVSVSTTLHAAARLNDQGRGHRPGALRAAPQARNLLLRHLTPGPDREGTLLVIPRR